MVRSSGPAAFPFVFAHEIPPLLLRHPVVCLDPASCVAQVDRLSRSFMYARPVVDGDDLAIIARSSIQAPNQHDADCAPFHRIPHFRKLALDLIPKEEGQ